MSRQSPATPTLRRAPLVAGLAALAALTTSGCGATGVDAQTNAQYQPGVGANVRSGAIQLYNALAVDNGDDTATVSVTILNRADKPVRLTSADARLSDGAKLTVTTAPAIIDAGETMATGPAGAVILQGSRIEAGTYVDLTLRFSGGGKATVEAPVVARTADYQSVATGPGGETATPAAEDATLPADGEGNAATDAEAEELAAH